MAFWKQATRGDRFLFLMSVGLLAFSVLLVGIHDRRLQASTEDEEFYRFVDVAAEVYSEIKNKYVEEVDSRTVLEGALSGMFRALDEHSQYMNPDMLKSLERDTSGEFSGIGIHISKRQGLLTVISPIPGSPAAEVGLQPWDRIIEIEGETTEGMDLSDAVKKLTGPSGTKVTFKVYRAGEKEPLEFTVTRQRMEIESVHSKMLENNIGYVRLTRFSENTTRDVRRALLEMKSQGMEGLIIDLRYNTGGLLKEAIDTADLFVDKGEMVVSTKGRMTNQNREYRSENEPICRLPLFVLVNEGSASASEILAGAIQDHRLGVILGPAGKNTFGKGSVQTISELYHTMTNDDDGNPMESAMRLTTAKYYTPSGRTIHHIGITPDIGVPLTRKHELELQRHGLIGDVFTGEDYHVDEETLEGASEEEEEGVDGGTQLQLREDEEEEIEPQRDPNKPFYEVKAPDLVSDEDFVDVMLAEAIKQMKIYMILEHKKAKSPASAIAQSLESDSVSVAK